MNRLRDFFEEYDYKNYPTLPKFIKRRVDALKKMQLEHIKIQREYYEKLHELDLEFEKEYNEVYEKRFKIISGQYEPTDLECELPSYMVADESFDRDYLQLYTKPLLTQLEESIYKDDYKGIPGFWLGCLVSSLEFRKSVEKHDRKLLRYLEDIRIKRSPITDGCVTHTLEFLFKENPYFSNKLLTKVYHLELQMDECHPLSCAGFRMCKSDRCDIKWKAEKDITRKSITVEQKINGQVCEERIELEQKSFFYFFKGEEIPEVKRVDGKIWGYSAQDDLEMGRFFRDMMIPEATLYYTGYLMPWVPENI